MPKEEVILALNEVLLLKVYWNFNASIERIVFFFLYVELCICKLYKKKKNPSNNNTNN